MAKYGSCQEKGDGYDKTNDCWIIFKNFDKSGQGDLKCITYMDNKEESLTKETKKEMTRGEMNKYKDRM